MNKNSRVFRPKASNIQKSFRENMLNKTQIHEEDRSIMNKSRKIFLVNFYKNQELII